MPTTPRLYTNPSHVTKPPKPLSITTSFFPARCMAHVNGFLSLGATSDLQCALSMPFSTATIIQWEIGLSQPVKILWKKYGRQVPFYCLALVFIYKILKRHILRKFFCRTTYAVLLHNHSPFFWHALSCHPHLPLVRVPFLYPLAERHESKDLNQSRHLRFDHTFFFSCTCVTRRSDVLCCYSSSLIYIFFIALFYQLDQMMREQTQAVVLGRDIRFAFFF